MNIKELEYLLSIVEEGNLSRAAEKLYTTQPNISRALSKIEKKINLPLFNKGRHPWSLTYAGEVFLNHANNIVNSYNTLQQDMKKILNGNKILLKIGLMPLEERILLPKILPIFNQNYPYCLLEINNIQPTEIEKALIEDIVNVAIVTLSGQNSELEYIPIKTYDILLILPLEHTLAKNYTYPKNNKNYPTIDLNLLKSYPFVSLNRQSALRKQTISLCQSYGFYPNITMDVQRTATAYNLVKVGYGASFILAEAVENYQKQHVACFKINNPKAKQTIAFAYKKNKKLLEEEKFLLKLFKNN